MSLADIGMKAYWYKDDLPEGMESGLEGSFTYDHPYTTLPSDDRTDLGVFYPMMGHAVHVVVVEVDVDTGQVAFLQVTSPCTTSARSSTRARCAARSAAGSRWASASR